ERASRHAPTTISTEAASAASCMKIGTPKSSASCRLSMLEPRERKKCPPRYHAVCTSRTAVCAPAPQNSNRTPSLASPMTREYGRESRIFPSPDESVQDVVGQLGQRKHRNQKSFPGTPVPGGAKQPRAVVPHTAIPQQLLGVRDHPDQRQHGQRSAPEKAL